MKGLKISREGHLPHADAQADAGLGPKSLQDAASYPYPSRNRDEEAKRSTQQRTLRDIQSKAEWGEHAPLLPPAQASSRQIDTWENEGGRIFDDLSSLSLNIEEPNG